MYLEDDALEGSMVVNDSSNVNLLPLSFGISKQIQGTQFGTPLTLLLDSGSTATWINKRCLPKGIQGYMVDKVMGSTLAGTVASTEQVLSALKILVYQISIPSGPYQNSKLAYFMLIVDTM